MLEKTKQFIINELERKQAIPANIAADQYDFIDAGHIDSMGIMKFIIAIEDEFDIELNQEEITSEAFRTVGGLAHLIEEKL